MLRVLGCIFFFAILAAPKCIAGLPQGCFDFSKKIVSPLKAPIPLKETEDHTDHGTFETEIDWGAARGIVKKPIQVIYKKLLDHSTMKDMTKTTLDTKSLKNDLFDDFHRVDVSVRVFGPITISWTEEWGYARTGGSKQAPTQYLISYHKIEGTNYIEHLCGSFLLKTHGPSSTDVFLYEQLKASRRNAQDTVRMHLGILRTLREDDPAPNRQVGETK